MTIFILASSFLSLVFLIDSINTYRAIEKRIRERKSKNRYLSLSREKTESFQNPRNTKVSLLCDKVEFVHAQEQRISTVYAQEQRRNKDSVYSFEPVNLTKPFFKEPLKGREANERLYSLTGSLHSAIGKKTEHKTVNLKEDGLEVEGYRPCRTLS